MSHLRGVLPEFLGGLAGYALHEVRHKVYRVLGHALRRKS